MCYNYDHVHSGSTQFFMDPDRTEANFNRAESSNIREEGRVDSEKLLEAGGYLCRRHIQSRAQTDYGVLQESLESTVVKTIPQTAMADRYCWNPYSNRRRLFEVQILVLRFGRVTIGIPTVTVTDSGLGERF